MFISATVKPPNRVVLSCDLSHENFVKLIEILHLLKYSTEITDKSDWDFYSVVDSKEVHAFWVDEDTFTDVIESLKVLSK